MDQRILYSFIIDEHPRFAWQGWHLARSLLLHCGAEPDDINVQVTAGVADTVIDEFAGLGCRIRKLARFGDGRFCNKLAQLPNLLDEACDRIVLLDTDMIAVEDLRPFLVGEAMQAKIVDTATPSLAALTEIFAAAGSTPPPTVSTDEPGGLTCRGNANGGFYDIPRPIADDLSQAWQTWVRWLLADTSILQRENKTAHVDQVGMALALHMNNIKFAEAPSNVNYFVHFKAERSYFDPARPIALLHYHNATLSMVGYIEPNIPLTPIERAAVDRANRQIREGFHNIFFWDFRYATHPQRGSGLGSRGENLVRKRAMLVANGIQFFESVLDVGCGDLQVMSGLKLKGYMGIDLSAAAIDLARTLRPDWAFQLFTGQDVPACEAVLCLEVLIHQRSRADYLGLVTFLAEHTEKTLFVSGYERKDNPSQMVFFHEPLSQSLAATQRFSRIAAVGSHSDVIVFRCDV